MHRDLVVVVVVVVVVVTGLLLYMAGVMHRDLKGANVLLGGGEGAASHGGGLPEQVGLTS